MKYLTALVFVTPMTTLYARAIYDSNGHYKGYSQTTPSGVTTT